MGISTRLYNVGAKQPRDDADCEEAMKPMGNRRSYLRHAFESHNGIKYTKLEAYSNWFPCRWMHIRKNG